MADELKAHSNPYDPPNSGGTEPGLFTSQETRGVRLWLYLHLLGFSISVVLASIDAGIVPLGSSYSLWLQLLLFPAVGSLVVCPLCVFFWVVVTKLSMLQRLIVFFAEFFIVIAHLGALAPMVQ